MSLTNNTRYIQLVTPKGEVLAQRICTGQPLSYYENKVWRVPSQHVIRVVEHSPLVQPDKFMQPLQRDAYVHIYSLDSSSENLPFEPSRTLAEFSIKADEIDIFSQEFQAIVGGWNAFSNGNWVGSSEY